MVNGELIMVNEKTHSQLAIINSPLERLSQNSLHLLPVAAAHLELRAVAQQDDVIAVVGGFEGGDAVQLYNRRAMDALELLRVELPFEVTHRLAQQMRGAAHVQPHVIIGGLDPVDLFDVDEKHAPAGFNHQPPQVRLVVRGRGGGGFAGGLFEQGDEALADFADFLLLDLRLRVREGRPEAVVFEGFEEVVEGVYLEGPQRMFR